MTDSATTPALTVVRDGAGFVYLVTEADPPLPQAWIGKRAMARGDTWQPRAKAKTQLVRKAGCAILGTIAGEG